MIRQRASSENRFLWILGHVKEEVTHTNGSAAYAVDLWNMAYLEGLTREGSGGVALLRHRNR